MPGLPYTLQCNNEEEQMTRHFEDDLTKLRDQILYMASLAEKAVASFVTALQKRDAALANAVITDDAEINNLEIIIEKLCLEQLARQQPMAKDLRFLTSAIKISNDIERIGDHAVNIAERTL